MNRFTITTFIVLFSSGFLAGQNQITVCQTPATESFALLSSQKDFSDEHLAPLPYKHKDGTGKMISFETPDGKTGHAYFVKANTNTDNYLFIFHEWWGLNDYIKKEADKYSAAFKKDVNILALDLYDGKIATTSEKASALVGQVTTERAEAIIRGAVEFAGNNAEIATLGWCFGGGWALQAAMIAGDQAQGAVMYYGMPEKDVEKIKNIDFPVLGIFAKKDGHITPEIVADFEKKMKAASKTIYIHNYDAVHAFANPSNPKYDKEAAEDAYNEALTFLKRVL